MPAKRLSKHVLERAGNLRRLAPVVIACSRCKSFSYRGVEVVGGPRGKWASVIAAIERHPSEGYLLIDSDMPISIKTAEKILRTLHSHDLVLIRRFPDNRSAVDKFLTLLFQLVARMLGVPFRDVQAGAKGFRRELILRVKNFLPGGYLGDLFIARYALLGGYRIVEIPAPWRDERTWSERIMLIALIALEFLREIPKIMSIGRLAGARRFREMRDPMSQNAGKPFKL